MSDYKQIARPLTFLPFIMSKDEIASITHTQEEWVEIHRRRHVLEQRRRQRLDYGKWVQAANQRRRS